MCVVYSVCDDDNSLVFIIENVIHVKEPLVSIQFD